MLSVSVRKSRKLFTSFVRLGEGLHEASLSGLWDALCAARRSVVMLPCNLPDKQELKPDCLLEASW